MPPFSGKGAILGALERMVADPAFSITFGEKRVGVSKSGDLAYSWGAYQVTNSASKHDGGFYLKLYRKPADGSWKVAYDAAVSEAAPLSPSQPAQK
jgi:ketosteroid isomerase-like protein